MFVTVWTPEKVAVLVEKYAEARNEDLVAELGVSMRTIERKAKALGLKKSERFLRDASQRGLMEIEYRRMMGEQVGGFKKGDGHKGTPGSFKKGHRFTGEIEEKRVKACRDRAWDERVRLIRGFPRLTKWKMKNY